MTMKQTTHPLFLQHARVLLSSVYVNLEVHLCKRVNIPKLMRAIRILINMLKG